MGTQGYASPEQIAGQAADCRDDVYALGVRFWQLTTHTLQFPGPMFAQELEASVLPELAKRLLGQCLGQRPQRPKDAAALLTLVQQLPETLTHTPVALQQHLTAQQQRLEAETARQNDLATQQTQQAQAARQAALRQVGHAPEASGPTHDLAADWTQLQAWLASKTTQAQAFTEAKQQHTLPAYADFVAQHPQAAEVAEAQKCIQTLRDTQERLAQQQRKQQERTQQAARRAAYLRGRSPEAGAYFGAMSMWLLLACSPLALAVGFSRDLPRELAPGGGYLQPAETVGWRSYGLYTALAQGWWVIFAPGAFGIAAPYAPAWGLGLALGAMGAFLLRLQWHWGAGFDG